MARIGFRIAFARPSTAAPSSSGPQPPMSTPSKIQSTTISATMFTPQPTSAPMANRWITARSISGDGGFAQECLHLAEEGVRRLHAIGRPELEDLRAERRIDVQDHRRLTREVLDKAREFPDQAGLRLHRVHPEPHLPRLLRGLERRHLHRDQFRLALLLVVDAPLH